MLVLGNLSVKQINKQHYRLITNYYYYYLILVMVKLFFTINHSGSTKLLYQLLNQTIINKTLKQIHEKGKEIR